MPKVRELPSNLDAFPAAEYTNQPLADTATHGRVIYSHLPKWSQKYVEIPMEIPMEIPYVLPWFRGVECGVGVKLQS